MDEYVFFARENYKKCPYFVALFSVGNVLLIFRDRLASCFQQKKNFFIAILPSAAAVEAEEEVAGDRLAAGRMDGWLWLTIDGKKTYLPTADDSLTRF
jgi:hypothetical protein